MSRQGLLYLLAGLAVVAVLIAGFVYLNRGNHLELSGAITDVRTLALDENASLLVVDYRIQNTSDVSLVVRKVDITIHDVSGRWVATDPVAEVDARRMFEYYPALGPKRHSSLGMRARVGAHQAVEAMAVSRLELPEPALKQRQDVEIRIEDVDGAVTVLKR